MAGKNKPKKLGEKGGANSRDIGSSLRSINQNLDDVKMQSQTANKWKRSTNVIIEDDGSVEHEHLITRSRNIIPLADKKSSLSTYAIGSGLKEKGTGKDGSSLPFVLDPKQQTVLF